MSDKLYIVTVKLLKDPNHDPHNKVEGICPIDMDAWCTDVTGEHHTTTVLGDEELEEIKKQYDHITRIESINV